MLRADRDRQRVGAALRHLDRFGWSAIDRFAPLVFPSKQADFRLQICTCRVSELNKSFRFADILGQRVMRAIVHHGVIPGTQGPNNVSVFAWMILVKEDGGVSGFGDRPDEAVEFTDPSI